MIVQNFSLLNVTHLVYPKVSSMFIAEHSTLKSTVPLEVHDYMYNTYKLHCTSLYWQESQHSVHKHLVNCWGRPHNAKFLEQWLVLGHYCTLSLSRYMYRQKQNLPVIQGDKRASNNCWDQTALTRRPAVTTDTSSAQQGITCLTFLQHNNVFPN